MGGKIGDLELVAELHFPAAIAEREGQQQGACERGVAPQVTLVVAGGSKLVEGKTLDGIRLSAVGETEQNSA